MRQNTLKRVIDTKFAQESEKIDTESKEMSAEDQRCPKGE